MAFSMLFLDEYLMREVVVAAASWKVSDYAFDWTIQNAFFMPARSFVERFG